MLTGYVYVDVADRDPQSYVTEAGALLHDQLKLLPDMPSPGADNMKPWSG